MPKSEKLEFQTEVSQLLKLMINSVYSEKEVFVRELVSNASDACDKLRYLSNTKEKLIKDDPNFKIQITIDKKNKQITIEETQNIVGDKIEKPSVVIIAAAKVGGILANSKFPTEFILNNLKIQTNLIELSRKHNVRRLLFLGSSCIYPKLAKQPLKEEYLLSGLLEKTNES